MGQEINVKNKFIAVEGLRKEIMSYATRKIDGIDADTALLVLTTTAAEMMTRVLFSTDKKTQQVLLAEFLKNALPAKAEVIINFKKDKK